MLNNGCPEQIKLCAKSRTATEKNRPLHNNTVGPHDEMFRRQAPQKIYENLRELGFSPAFSGSSAGSMSAGSSRS